MSTVAPETTTITVRNNAERHMLSQVEQAGTQVVAAVQSAEQALAGARQALTVGVIPFALGSASYGGEFQAAVAAMEVACRAAVIMLGNDRMDLVNDLGSAVLRGEYVEVVVESE